MITIRKGKTRSILDSSRNSAILAVEAYNKPTGTFRVENYIILMVIAWTKLFHSYFQSTIGERYFYKTKNGRYSYIDGERKAWELKECIKQYQASKPYHPLSEATIKNLEFIVSLRNKIEHRFWDSSELMIQLFGECQALLCNYENLLVTLFGDKYSINANLAFALQFSRLRSDSQIKAQRTLLSKDMRDIKRYIDEYRSSLPQDIFDSQEYSIKLLQIPKISNTNRSDLAVEFVNWNSLSEEDQKNYNKLLAIIKDKIVVQNVSNANLLRPSRVIDAVFEATGVKISSREHILLWKAFGIRPTSHSSESEFETNEIYCVFDEPHRDYVYTANWVDFVSNLVTNYGFSHGEIAKLCNRPLRCEDYPSPEKQLH